MYFAIDSDTRAVSRNDSFERERGARMEAYGFFETGLSLGSLVLITKELRLA
jgi:hypothetical protein